VQRSSCEKIVPFAGYSIVRVDGTTDGKSIPPFFVEAMRPWEIIADYDRGNPLAREHWEAYRIMIAIRS
jgi:hypothetical protein